MGLRLGVGLGLGGLSLGLGGLCLGIGPGGLGLGLGCLGTIAVYIFCCSGKISAKCYTVFVNICDL